MNALLIPRLSFMPCSTRLSLLESDRGTTGTVAAKVPAGAAPNTLGDVSATRPSLPIAVLRDRIEIPASVRRAGRFAGGLLIGAALWAMVFAASAATQFSVLG